MLNHITIMGRLTRDPEVRSTGSGITIANFTLAVDRDFSGKDGGEKETDFIDCVAWRKTAEFIIKYFQKGSMMAASGRLQIDNWTDDKGNKRRSAKVNVNNVYFAGAKQNQSQAQQESTPYQRAQAAIEDYRNANPPQAPIYPEDDYAVLTDDDEKLPF